MHRRRRVFVGLALVLSMSTLVIMGGSLTPPLGPVGSTMKTLDEVRPGTPVNSLPGASDAVYVISQPGSYYLTGDVIGQTGKHGILVTASGHVSLSSSGFSLIGTPGSMDGIRATGNAAGGFASLDATGNLTDSGKSASDLVITGWGGNGVRVEQLASVHLSGLLISDCSGHGVHSEGVASIELESVSVANPGMSGLFHVMNGDGTVIKLYHCSASHCAQDGVHIENPDSAEISGLDVVQCGGNGLSVTTLGLQPRGGDILIHGDSSIRKAGVDGVHVENLNSLHCDGVRVYNCVGNGFDVSDTPMQGNQCLAKGNGGHGLKDHFQNGDIPTSQQFGDLIDSFAVSNQGDGFLFVDCGARLTGGGSTGNGGAGLRRQRINEIETVLKNIGILAMTVSGNGGPGITTEGGNITATNVQLRSNGGSGMQCSGAIAAVLNGNVVIGNLRSPGGVSGGGGLVFNECGLVEISDSTIQKNGGSGIRVGNTGINSPMPYTTLHVSRSVADANTDTGIEIVAGSLSSVVIEDSSASSNGSDGVRFGIGVTAPANPLGITVSGVTCGNNGGNGLYVTGGSAHAGWSLGHIHDNIASRNTGFGIYCDSGFAGGDIERNTCTGNAGGLQVEGTGNLVVSNSATSGTLGGISIAMPGNVAGPTIDGADIATNCNPRANVLH